ncbi:MAG: hypothetical protein N2Z22_07895 [Turneriella sp.]|nr:hypothetical protein [Turneriella sp.]
MTRKELVQALEAKWGVKATYLGVPSCAYEIYCEAGNFLIDRQGVVRDQTGRKYSTEEILSQPQTDPAEEPETNGRKELPPSGYAVELSLEGHTAASLRNLVNMLASKEKLLVSTFALTRPLLDSRLVEELGKRNALDMESFQAVWTEAKSGCSHGLELDFDKQTLTLKLLKASPTPDEMAAFRDLAVCMNKYAQKLKRSLSKPAQGDNPKYAMRTWLLRLGMNGDAFKLARKVLLARLAGSAAFRTPAEAEKHKARLLAKKQKPCEVDGNVD